MSKKVRPPATGPANQSQLRFNDDAGSDKISESGFNFFSGGAILLGAIDTAKKCGKYKPVYIFNSGKFTAFVAFGASTVGAPATGAAGVPIPTLTGIVLSSGSNEYVRGSDSDVLAYVANENVVE